MDQYDLIRHLFEQQRILIQFELLANRNPDPRRSCICERLAELRLVNHRTLDVLLFGPYGTEDPRRDSSKW
jgi:hypothetical protein